jgi:MFS family permease
MKWRPQICSFTAFSVLVPGFFGTPIGTYSPPYFEDRYDPDFDFAAYAILDHLNWRWCFWVCLICHTLAFVLSIMFYFPPTFSQKHVRDHVTKWKQFREFDRIGLTLFVVGLILLLVGLNFGGTDYPWKSAPTIATITVGGITLVVFGLYEAVVPLKAQLIPPALGKDVRGVVTVFITTFIGGMLLYSLAALWPEQVQAVYSTNLGIIGWASTTVVGGAVVGSLSLSQFLGKLGHARYLYVLAVAMQTAFIGAMAAMSKYPIDIYVYGLTLLISFHAQLP